MSRKKRKHTLALDIGLRGRFLLPLPTIFSELASMSPSLPSSSARRLLPSKRAPIFPASPFTFSGSKPSDRNCGNLSASGEAEDGTRSLLGESGVFAVDRSRRAGEGGGGDCACCLVGELVRASGSRNGAGSPKISVEFRGRLKAEEEGMPDANKQAPGDEPTFVKTDFSGCPWVVPLFSDEIERI
jgi:hypothetical protein